jgi:hypothetical protein
VFFPFTIFISKFIQTSKFILPLSEKFHFCSLCVLVCVFE